MRFKYRGCGTESLGVLQKKNKKEHLFKVTAGGLSEHNTALVFQRRDV